MTTYPIDIVAIVVGFVIFTAVLIYGAIILGTTPIEPEPDRRPVTAMIMNTANQLKRRSGLFCLITGVVGVLFMVVVTVVRYSTRPISSPITRKVSLAKVTKKPVVRTQRRVKASMPRWEVVSKKPDLEPISDNEIDLE